MRDERLIDVSTATGDPLRSPDETWAARWYLILGIKIPLVLYGLLGLLAVPAAVLIGHGLGEREPADTPRVRSHPPPLASADSLATRLSRLNASRDQGLLTDAEYEAKRKHIVDTTEF